MCNQFLNRLDNQTKAKYKKELAEELGLSLSTFQRRLKEANIEIPRGLINPDKQLEIYKKLGWLEMMRSDAF